MQQSVKAQQMIKDHIDSHTFDIDTQHKRFLKHVNKDEKKLDESLFYAVNIDIKPDSIVPLKVDIKDPVKMSKVRI
jgi:hypothetical protein